MITPAHPQEYIIDEYTLNEIERLLNMPEHARDESDYDAQNTALKLIRSRPHSSIQSRDQVLDEFKNWVIYDLVFCDSIGADHMFSHELILDKIESLRTQGSRDP